jgi:hypothetical protein
MRKREGRKRRPMDTNVKTTDFLVEIANPEALDDTLQQTPMMTARVVGRGMPGGITYQEGYPVVRVFGDPSWFLFVAQEQGYCNIIRQRD